MSTPRLVKPLTLVLALSLLLLTSCSSAETPAPTQAISADGSAPTEVSQETAPETEALSPCAVTEDMVGQTLRVSGQLSVLDHSDPEGIYGDLTDRACHVGLWVSTQYWEGWDANAQALLQPANWLTISGTLVSFEGNLIIQASAEPPVAAEASFVVSTASNPPEIGDYPPSFSLDVPHVFSSFNDGPALCYLGAYAMVAMYHTPELTFADIMAFSGLGTHVTYLAPPDMDPFVSNGYWDAGLVNAAQAQGADIVAAALQGGFLYDMEKPEGIPLDENTATVYYFESGEQALAYLKYTLSNGHPVEVYLNLYYVFDDFVEQSQHWATSMGKDQASHYMTVSGYTEETLIISDPTDPTEAGTHLEASTEAFMQAWENTLDIPGAPSMGPYWMLYLADGGTIPDAEAIIDWNLENASGTPDAFRSFAANPGYDDFTRFMLNELARGSLEFGNYVDQNGHPEAAALFYQVSDKISDLVLNGITVDGILEVADLEGQALTALAMPHVP